MSRASLVRLAVAAAAACLAATGARAQVVIGQDGKDVVYLPTPPELVEAMLDLARVTAQDYVVDLGSGDGRIVIAAAKRGARALGIEYDTNLVALSEANAVRAGVHERATFVEADLFESDFSQATVVTTFLVADIMVRLKPQFAALRPGSRVVSNAFTIEGWAPDRTVKLEACSAWCTAHLSIVPAQVEGRWRFGAGELTLTQDFQMIAGTLVTSGTRAAIGDGRIDGDRITFRTAQGRYSGRVAGDIMEGTLTAGTSAPWRATRLPGTGQR
jgi:precorrin-6B methylase 2